MIALIAGPGKPPRSVQGLGLPYLGAVLEEAGFEVRIFDVYPPSPDTDDPVVLDQRLADAIAREEPSIVGVTIHTPAYADRVRLARFLRERLPQTLLIAGGHQPTAEPEHLLRDSVFDVCVVGEGEETLLEIAQQMAWEKVGRARAECVEPDTRVSVRFHANRESLRSIRGIVFKDDDRTVRTQPRPPIPDLDSLPALAHHLLGLENYAPHPNLGIRSTGIITYRGCPMECVFCCNPLGTKVRERSPSRVAEEMERVVRRFDVSGFNFYDNLFGLNRQHALALCEEILLRKLDVVWDCWTAGDLVDAELAQKMKAAGCVRLGFGAESGDDEVLGKSRRGFTAAQHLAGIRALKTVGLKVDPFFMIGLPGESAESIQRTVEFAKECGADEICLSLHRPYPGTALWQNPEAFGARIVKGPNFEAYIETEDLSRSAMLECAHRAGDELKRRGLMKDDFLRFDQYEWE